MVRGLEALLAAQIAIAALSGCAGSGSKNRNTDVNINVNMDKAAAGYENDTTLPQTKLYSEEEKPANVLFKDTIYMSSTRRQILLYELSNGAVVLEEKIRDAPTTLYISNYGFGVDFKANYGPKAFHGPYSAAPITWQFLFHSLGNEGYLAFDEVTDDDTRRFEIYLFAIAGFRPKSIGVESDEESPITQAVNAIKKKKKQQALITGH